MNRFVFTLSVLILGGLASGCSSLNEAIVFNTAKPGIIIECRDLAGSYTVYVDGKKIGRVFGKETKGYELSNGNHTIITANRDGMPSDPIRFTINDDRHYIIYESGRLSSYNITPIETPVLVKSSDTRLLNTAITNSFKTVSRNIPVNSEIAIVNIASDNNVDSGFILEELTLAFVNSGLFTIVDRQTLNIIRAEQNFQLSGEVSDEDIISIGKFIGADVVITGSVSGNGEMRRLRLRALDVKTAQILAMSAEKI
jgi:hypothetical protein